MIIEAKKVAEKINGTYVPRSRFKGVSHGETPLPLLVITKEGIVCHFNDQKFFYHPSMAMLRIKRVMKGEKDIFNTLCGDINGFSVLDCTMGFGSDSLVFSYLVGALGKVTALEVNELIYTVISDGLMGNYPKWEEINTYNQRITAHNQDYLSYLSKCKDDSYHIVYFDPMFDKPLIDSTHLDPLREFAKKEQITLECIELAKKVAKKYVIIKNTMNFNFEQLGLTETFNKRSSKVKYGIIRL